MITLTVGQTAINAPEYKVAMSGDYNEDDLVLVYGDDPELAIGQFSAKFIATGEF